MQSDYKGRLHCDYRQLHHILISKTFMETSGVFLACYVVALSFHRNKPKVRQCLLSFSAECFVLQFDIQKRKDQYIQNYNIGRCYVWVRNLVADNEGGS
jgi:hypothetical protein